MFEGVTEQIVDFARGTEYDDLPREAVDKTKLVLLDSLGCALGGHVTDRAKLALELIEESGGKPQSSIVGGHRTSYDRAAFANGELISGLDYDILGPITGSHVTPYVTPPCLAIAEKVHASGKDLITALALAHEIGGRFLASVAGHKIPKEDPPYYEDSPRFSHAYSLFGGVVGACKLLGLDARKMANALGIAGASAPVPAGQKWEFITGPAIMVKYNAWTGWASQLATVATLLAEKGFTGDTAILDGEWGFWKIVGSPFFREDALFETLGEDWLADFEFKKYPVCGQNRKGIEGIRRILKEHGIRPEEIHEIVVKADPFMLTPNRSMVEVASFADMQFSNVNIFSVAAYYGDIPSPAWQMPMIYDDPRVRALAKKVKVGAHPDAERYIVESAKTGKRAAVPCLVEIRARGDTFVTEVTKSPRGTTGDPMTEAELVEKFATNASYSPLPSDRVEEIVQTIGELEELPGISRLTRLLTIG